MLNPTLLKTLLATAAALAVGSVSAASVSGQGTWETTLQARDLDRDGKADAYFDSALNISWLADADVIGSVSFAQASAWASNLDVAGVTGWRLPTIHIDSCGFGPTFWNGGGTCGYGVLPGSSDMAHMNVVTLGNESHSGYVDDYGNGPGVPDAVPLLTNTGPFRDIQSYGYWFSLEYAIDGGQRYDSFGWRYSFHAGRQDWLDKQTLLNAWAVHDGDVGLLAAVPEPQTYALMLAGLGLMSLIARRRLADRS